MFSACGSTVVMFKALGNKVGLGKGPPSEGLIEKHRSQRATHVQWKEDVGAMKAVSTKLAKSYQRCKTTFAINRYEDLKNMIKEAVSEFREVEHTIKTRPVIRSSVVSSEAPQQKMGLMTKLKLHAQNFAEHQDELMKQEKDYAAMTTQEVEADMEKMRKEVISLKQEYYSERDKLSKLSQAYEDSKKLNPTKRYEELKHIIKIVIRT